MNRATIHQDAKDLAMVHAEDNDELGVIARRLLNQLAHAHKREDGIAMKAALSAIVVGFGALLVGLGMLLA